MIARIGLGGRSRWLSLLASLGCAVCAWAGGGWAHALFGEHSASTGSSGSAPQSVSALAPAAASASAADRWLAVPAAARGPISAALGADDPAYRIHDFAATNLAQALRAKFSAAGVTVSAGSLRVRFTFSGIGRAGSARAGTHLSHSAGSAGSVHDSTAAPRVAGTLIHYRRLGVTETWSNGPLGLEQTFVVGSRPVGTGDLRLSVGVSGTGVRLHRASDGSILLSERGQALRYGGLLVTDARGRSLPARLSVVGSRMVITVDDRDARYPLRVDPYVQSVEFTSADGANEEEFGWSIAISGHTVAVGSPYHSVDGNFRQGAVYVFSEPAAGWSHVTQTAELTAADGAAGDNLGWSVAISGDTIVAGAPSHTVASNESQGAVYVFARPSGGWHDGTQTAELQAADGAADDILGMSVAIAGRTVVAGADEAAVGANNNEGAAYVFSEPSSGWRDERQSAKLTASDGASFDAFAWAVAIAGDTIVVGAPNHTVGTDTYQGSAYVYTEPASGWADATQTAELTSSNGVIFSGFGHAVTIDGDTVAVGAYAQTVATDGAAGAVYVFTKPGAGWATATQTAELTAADVAANQYLGISVAVSGDTIVTGADAEQVGANAGQGAIYVYTKGAGGWSAATQTAKLTASDGTAEDSLGAAVAVSGLTVVGSATDHTVGSSFEQGTSYLFTQPATTSLNAELTGGGASARRVTMRAGSAAHADAALVGADAEAATGTVSYRVYRDPRCTKLVAGGARRAIATPGTLPASAAVRLSRVGTYYWRVAYGGDASNASAISACDALIEIVNRATLGRIVVSSPATTLAATAACTGPGKCALAFLLTVAGAHRSRIVVGSATLVIGGGLHRTVSVKLNSAGRRLLRSRRQLTARLTVSQSGVKFLARTVTFKLR